MSSRVLAVVALSLLGAASAHASILSASSQAVREPSMSTAGYWTAVTLQQGLNETLRSAAEATAPSALGSNRPSLAMGGLLVNESGSGAAYTPFSESDASNSLFEMPNGSSDAFTSGSWSTETSRGGLQTEGRGRGRGRDDWGPGRRDWPRDRDNPYATPEPSTWMLLGSGLLMLVAYAGWRRRQAASV